MRKKLFTAVFTVAIAMTSAMTLGQSSTPQQVVPINWAGFSQLGSSTAPANSQFQKSGQILLNSVKYNASRIPTAFNFDNTNQQYTPKTMNEDGIRPGAHTVFGIAVALQTGLFDATTVGMTEAQLRTRNAQLIKGLAASHVANKSGGWGDQWQSALWASQVAQAGWMNWNDLDAATRQSVVKMTVHEANRFIPGRYVVPYWNGVGGDSKGEENAWNAMIGQVAANMMPNHPQANDWKRKASELMVSGFARNADRTSTQMVDGKPVSDWLNGYNLRDDGNMQNHDRVHPDYSITVAQNLRSGLISALAGKPMPEAGLYGGKTVWNALTTVNYPSPTYNAPGGTIYKAAQASVYYPEGTDWFPLRFDTYYRLDTLTHFYGLESQNPAFTAAQWMDLRATQLQNMQARGTTGQTYQPSDGASTNSESIVSFVIGDAYLSQWLNAQNKLPTTANWIRNDVVRNGGFEGVAVDPGQDKRFSTAIIDGWTVKTGTPADAGVANKAGDAAFGAEFDDVQFDGDHRGLFLTNKSGKAALSVNQTIDGLTLTPNTRYVLSVDISARGLSANESYIIRLLAGNTMLSQKQGGLNGAPVLIVNDFQTITLLFESGTTAPAGIAFGEKIGIDLINPTIPSGSNNSAQTYFDDVTLSVTPIPEPLSMGLISPAALLLRRVRR